MINDRDNNYIKKLEQENKILKDILIENNIEYINILNTRINNSNFNFSNLDEEAMNKCARLFYSYFWGRTDVYALRSKNPNNNKTAYYPQCKNRWENFCLLKSKSGKCKDCPYRQYSEINKEIIKRHLLGKNEKCNDVVGIYPLLKNNTCRLIVFDFDNHNENAEFIEYANTDLTWIEEVDALRRICEINNIPFLVERSRSGKGAHLWIFFDCEVDAALARKFAYSLLEKGSESVNLTSFKYYDRMLPAQDFLKKDSIGNLIALPLQGQALKNGNSCFVDDNWNTYVNQWDKLLSTKKLSKATILDYIRQWNKASFDDIEDFKPWEIERELYKEDVDGAIDITIKDRIYINKTNLRPRIQYQLRKLASFSNPVFYKNQAIGLSNYNESRIIYLGEDLGNYICLPRGLHDEIINKLTNNNIQYKINDLTTNPKKINVSFKGNLKTYQETFIEELLKYNNGILNAATASGKTVVGINVISRLKTNTLIIVDRIDLINQWKESIENFLDINEELPTYSTKTGRIRKRKEIVGIISSTTDTSNGIIDIATAGSIISKGELHPRFKDYGLIIIDECHHAASKTYQNFLTKACSKYLYGLTATPLRSDDLTKVFYMLLGPIRYSYTSKDRAIEQGIDHLVIPRFTRVVNPHLSTNKNINEAYELIRNSNIRNEQIIDDIKECIANKRTVLVLTKYVNQATTLYTSLEGIADKLFILTGNLNPKERNQTIKELQSVNNDESLILIATGQLVGEGFNLPRLDTLILASPIAFEGLLEQYVGRLNRDFPGKENVLVYDYIDSYIPVFKQMYLKRLKAYRRVGYKIKVNPEKEFKENNAIYSSENYFEFFKEDLLSANNSIVISSQTLSNSKVKMLIDLLKDSLEKGVKITIITWHPDAYIYGWDEHRLGLLKLLFDFGFNIEFVKNDCQQYAILDDEVVWYGSMNLLSKDDIDDNIMRILSNKIAQELSEMSYKNYIDYDLNNQVKLF